MKGTRHNDVQVTAVLNQSEEGPRQSCRQHAITEQLTRPHYVCLSLLTVAPGE